jgi:hypothetical protein
MDSSEMAATTGSHVSARSEKAVSRMRAIAAKPATFATAAM